MPNPEPPSVQVNIGLIQRTAAGDYTEEAVKNAKTLLMSMPQYELDAQSIDNEHLFHERFGFWAASAARKDIVDIKHKHDLLDKEILSLWRAGHLRIHRDRAYIEPERSMYVSGWLMLGVFSAAAALLVLTLGMSKMPEWEQLGSQIGVLVAWFGAVSIVHKFYIGPWSTVKRCCLQSHLNGESTV